MKITNVKERTVTLFRFIGLYILGIAILAVLIISSGTVSKVDNRDSMAELGQLRKRDEAFKEIYRLSVKLNEMQRHKQTENYDGMWLQFEKELDALQRKYLNDTAIYKMNYDLASLLRNFHKEFERANTEYTRSVDIYVAQITNLRDSAKQEIEDVRSQGSGSKDDLATEQRKNITAAEKIDRLQQKLVDGEKENSRCSTLLTALNEKCRNSADVLDNISTGINEIESKAKDIKGNIISRDNKNIRSIILAQVDNIRNNANKVKRTIAP